VGPVGRNKRYDSYDPAAIIQSKIMKENSCRDHESLPLVSPHAQLQ